MKIETTMSGISKTDASCDEIRPILQGIDPLFEIEFNYNNEEYIIYFNGGFFQSVPWDEFSRDTIHKIEVVYWKNLYGDLVSEVDEHNDKIKRSKESKRDDMIYEMSKDMRKAILKDF